MTTSRKPRLAIVAVLATSLVAVFAALGGVGVAESAISAVQYQYGQKKVTICHKGKKTMRVGKKAAIAHMRRHHDTLGSCADARKKGKHRKHGEKAEHGKKAEHGQKAKDETRAKAKGDDDKSEVREQEKPGHGGKGKGRGK